MKYWNMLFCGKFTSSLYSVLVRKSSALVHGSLSVILKIDWMNKCLNEF